MKTIYLFLITIALATLSFNCIGPKGEDGLDGVNGRDGLNGKDANVGAAVYDVEPSKWNGNVDGFVTTLNVPEITDNIYYNGAVLVYMIKNENSADKSFNQLPYTWLFNGTTEYMDFDAFIGQIDITIRWVDNGVNSTEAPTQNYTFKVIVIEGTQLSVLEKQVDVSDPNAVMNYFSGKTIF